MGKGLIVELNLFSVDLNPENYPWCDTDEARIAVDEKNYNEGNLELEMLTPFATKTMFAAGDETILEGLTIEQIIEKLNKLEKLESAGVDNWEGYNEALQA